MSFFELLRRRSNGQRVLIFGPANTSEPSVDGLLEDEAFARAYVRASSVIQEHSGISVAQSRAEIDDPAKRFQVNFLQEVAAQLAVVRALEDHGLTFDAIAATSLGELAAAHACGASTFEETARVACCMVDSVIQALGGDLIIVRATAAATSSILRDVRAEAIIDLPLSSVWAVTDGFIDEFMTRLGGAKIETLRLNIRCMPHTSDVNIAQLRKSLEWLKPRVPTIPYYSCVTGGLVMGQVDTDFWITMCSESVYFNEMHSALQRDGFRSMVHVGSVLLESEAFSHLSRRQRPELRRASDLLGSTVSAA